MMDLNKLYELLSVGELSNLALSGEGSGTIIENKRPTIIKYANDALLRLYTRFPLRTSDVLLEMQEHITQYRLETKYTESAGDPTEKYLYIKDLGNEPYIGDCLKILSVHTDKGAKLPLNDPDNVFSVYTPQAHVLQVPAPITGRSLAVTYQASHPTLDVDDESIMVELPPVLVPALISYVAGKVYSGMNSQENIAKGQEQLAAFDTICEEILEGDIASSSVSNTNTKFDTRGFV